MPVANMNIIKAKTARRKGMLLKSPGTSLFAEIFFIILSKKFPRGQRFPHQKRPAKKEITIGLTIQKIAARANLKSKRLKESIAIKRIKEKFFQILKIVFMLTMLACRKRKFCDKITK